MAVIKLCHFLAVQCVGLQCAILAFPGCIHLLLNLTFSVQFCTARTTELSLMMPIVI